jgi:hypothetical protein
MSGANPITFWLSAFVWDLFNYSNYFLYFGKSLFSSRALCPGVRNLVQKVFNEIIIKKIFALFSDTSGNYDDIIESV